jgi:ribonuclease HI
MMETKKEAQAEINKVINYTTIPREDGKNCGNCAETQFDFGGACGYAGEIGNHYCDMWSQRTTIVKIFIDACSKGNPGPASFGIVAHLPDDTYKKESGKLGNLTNQMAEFMAMKKALEMAHLYGWSQIAIFTDSRLMAQSANGKWKLKSQPLIKIVDEMVPMAQKIKSVVGGSITVEWVPRETSGIIEADKLANEALNPKLT